MYVDTFEQYGADILRNKEEIAHQLLGYYHGGDNADETCRSKAALLQFLRGKTPNAKKALMAFIENQDDADRIIQHMYDRQYVEATFGKEWEAVWAKWVDSGEWVYHTESAYYRPLLEAVKRQPYDGMVLYRALSVPADKDVLNAVVQMHNYTGAGIYWSYSFNGAVDYEATDRTTSNKYILQIKAPYGIINATQTLYKSIYPLAREREVELEPGSVELMAMWSVIGKDAYAVKKSGYPTRKHDSVSSERFASLPVPPAMKIRVA